MNSTDDDPVQASTREWLANVIAKTGWSATRLARECGVAVSTIVRFQNNPDVKHTLSARTIAKIAAKTGIPAPGNITRPTDTDPEILRHALDIARESTASLPPRDRDRLEAQLAAEIYDSLISAELGGQPLQVALTAIRTFINRRLRRERGG